MIITIPKPQIEKEEEPKKEKKNEAPKMPIEEEKEAPVPRFNFLENYSKKKKPGDTFKF